MKPVKKELVFWEEGILTGEDPVGNPFRIEASQLKEANVLAGVGCAVLYVTYKDENEQILCRFSMSCLKPAGEFCKIVNYCIQTGTAQIPKKKEQLACPQCGRPLPEGLEVCFFCYNRKAVLARAFELLKPFSAKLGLSEIILAFSSLLFLAPPFISRFLIDQYLKPRTGTWADIVFLAGAMLAARILGGVLYIFGSRIFNKASVGFAT